MSLESISVENALAFYKVAVTVMNGGSQDAFEKQSDLLIENQNMEYIERKEYFGEIPDLQNLVNIDLPDECLDHEVIHEFMEEMSEEKWEELSDEADAYIRYELPFYQRINYFLLPYKTRIANIDFGQEDDFIISVPLETEKEWNAWDKALKQGEIKLTFYPPLNDQEVLKELTENLGS